MNIEYISFEMQQCVLFDILFFALLSYSVAVNSINIEDVTGKCSSAFSLVLFNNTENNTKENTTLSYMCLCQHIYIEYIVMVTQQFSVVLFSV